MEARSFQGATPSAFSEGLTAEGMSYKTYGQSVLHALKLAVEKEVLSFRDRRTVWALATHYADGQPMVTATLVVCSADDAIPSMNS